MFYGIFHLYTPYARTYFMTVPIATQSRGKVVEVFVKTNQPLKKGDPPVSNRPGAFSGRSG